MEITGKNFIGFDFNVYEPVFKCECGYEEIYWEFKYCPICGIELEIEPTMIFSDEQCEKIPNDFLDVNEVK